MKQLKSGSITVSVDQKSSIVSVRDRRTDKIWQGGDNAFVLTCWDQYGERLKRIESGEKEECQIRFSSSSQKRQVVTYYFKTVRIGFKAVYTISDDCLKVSIPISGIKEDKTKQFKLLNIEVMPLFGRVRTGEDGYLLLPNYSGVICRFNKKESRVYRDFIYSSQDRWENFTDMPIFGIVHRESAFLGIISSGEFDAEVITVANYEKDRANSIYPCFHYRYEQIDEIDKVNREVRYHFLTGKEANYVGMAKVYRNYLLKDRKLKTLREKAVKNQVIRYAYNAYDQIKILHGFRVPQFNGKGELPINTTFKEAKKIVSDLKKTGIDKAILMLVGWNRECHDGLFPTRFPVEHRLGGKKDFLDLIKHAKSLGYHITVHDNYVDAYPNSPEWDPNSIVMHRDGSLASRAIFAGGEMHSLCPWEGLKFAKRDLPKMKEMGLQGIYYIDAMPSPLQSCFNKKHQTNRRGNAEGLKKIACEVSKVFGGCEVETAHNFIFDSIDSVSQIKVIADSQFLKETELYRYFIDDFVPFLPIACHGIILYHLHDIHLLAKSFGSFKKGFLKELEYGAKPRMQIVWRKTKQFDMTNYRKYLPIMKKQYDVICKQLGHLQLEFIEDHQEIAPLVFATTYSDGSRIVVNYRNKGYKIGKSLIKPKSFALIV